MLRKLNNRRGGFTLVEIMIVVAIIALLAAIAVPNFLRSRKRSQATQLLEDLRQIDSAIDQYAIERNKKSGDGVNWDDIRNYLKKGTRLETSEGKDILGGSFTGYSIDPTTGPQVKPATTSYDKLTDVAPADFWSPYTP